MVKGVMRCNERRRKDVKADKVRCRVIFFFNDTATTEIYTRGIVGSVRCV